MLIAPLAEEPALFRPCFRRRIFDEEIGVPRGSALWGDPEANNLLAIGSTDGGSLQIAFLHQLLGLCIGAAIGQRISVVCCLRQRTEQEIVSCRQLALFAAQPEVLLPNNDHLFAKR